jgi:hypothetical protein
VLDEGQGPVKEFQLGGRDDLVGDFQIFVDSLSNIRNIRVSDKVEFGTDTGPFIIAGLPGINMNQDSPEYKYTHHSAADALEEVKPDVLAQDATLMAMTAFWIADRPERFAKPWPANKTARCCARNTSLNSSGPLVYGRSAIRAPKITRKNLRRLNDYKIHFCLFKAIAGYNFKTAPVQENVVLLKLQHLV